MPKAYAKRNQQLTVPEHFYRSPRSSKWYVRLVAPEHVRPYVDQLDFRRSTGHADLRLAKPIGMALITEKLREWDSLAKSLGTAQDAAVPTVLTGDLIERLCEKRLYSWMRTDDEDRLSGLRDEDLADIEDFCKLTDAAMRSVLAQGPGSSRWCDVVESAIDWCLTLKLDIDARDPLFTRFVRDFAAVEREAHRRIALRNEGEPAETPASSERYTLSSVESLFRAEKGKNGRTKHLDTMLNAWRLFVSHCGDIELTRVTPAHVYEFMDARMHAATKSWSEKRAKTFGRATLREVFALAAAKGWMPPVNPVEELKTFPILSADDEAKHQKPRLPFSNNQLNELFGSAWYDPSNETLFRGKMRTDLGARYWAPLIGLFHGNRVREAVQLVASDFSFSADLLVMTFRTALDAEAGDAELARVVPRADTAQVESLRSLKNGSAFRSVPVHPTLVELGFVQFVEGRRRADGSNALLFPSSVPVGGGKSPKLGRAYEQAFLRFVVNHLGFGRGYGNHSFRHQLEDRVRDAQARKGVWPPGLGQQYTGRKRTRADDRAAMRDEGSERDYGFGYTPEAMLPYVKAIDFSDVRLPPSYPDWMASRGKQ